MTTLGSTPTLIRNVRITGPTALLLPESELYDLQLRDGRVADIAPAGNLRLRGEEFDAGGQWAIPGLWDHHVHMTPWALAARRVSLLEATSALDAAARMCGTRPNADGVRIGIGFRDALWEDAPSLEVLDAATGDVPTYLVNADLHSMWLNSAALRREGRVAVDGVLREGDAFAVASTLDQIAPDRLDLAVSDAADAAAARGVVGIVDLDMAWNAEAWGRRAAAGFDALRVRFGVYPEHVARAVAEGLCTGDAIDDAGLITVGAVKIITDGSLGTRTAACRHPYGTEAHHGVLTVPPDELRSLLLTATGSGLAVAVHAIGDVAVGHALDVFAETGAVGTLEHAQLVARADIPRFARLDVTASIQPSHAVDDRDLVEAEWGRQQGLAYPMRSLVDAGANVVFGSDAPVARLDPWVTIADAVARTGDERYPWRGEEAVDNATALAASTARGSAADTDLSPGAPADIALCGADPFSATPDVLRTMPVGATLLAGRITHLD